MSARTLVAALARAEGARGVEDDGARRRRAARTDAQLERAQRLRHLVHLLPDDRVLELGCGDGGLARALLAVTRGECRLTAASLRAGAPRPEALPAQVEHVALDDLPGPLASRRFHVVVATDLLAAGGAELLRVAFGLLAPGGHLVLMDPNPWRPLARRRVLPRAELIELLSGVGFVRAQVAFEELLPGLPTRPLRWLARNLSTAFEQAPGARALSARVVVQAQRPSHEAPRVPPSLAEHEALRGAVSVVVPCRNEEMNVGPLVDALRALYDPYLHEVILVDDGSVDGTRDAIRRLAAEDRRVKPVLRDPPNGVGRALRDGFRAATGRWVLTLDCDFQHLLPEVRDLFDAAARGREVVVGSRFSRHAVVRRYPALKVIANRGFHLLARLVLGSAFRDLTNNLKLVRRDVLERLPLVQPGFAANAETGLLPVLLGCDVEEVPTAWIDRDPDMGASSFRLARVGGGYAQVLIDVARARWLGVGPYARVLARGARGRTVRGAGAGAVPVPQPLTPRPRQEATA